MKADLSGDELARLQSLHSLDILDTPPEERFDRITRLAKRIFDVPIALISFVDDKRQWFKSRLGLTVCQTPRDISFCGHAILDDEIFVIPDTSQDPRFKNNPLVVGEPYIRFYAGYPFRDTSGRKLGTLCIIDSQPRAFEARDLEALTDLGKVLEHKMAAMQLAMLDELTGVANRRSFTLVARHDIEVYRRHAIDASLVSFDLDEFKGINDIFGHAAGDHALITFVEHLKASCRYSDIVARLGGDEFAVLLTGANRDAALKIIDKLWHSLDDFNRQQPGHYNIRFSYGIVEFDPMKHPNIETLLRDSDTLMYQNKQRKTMARES